MPSSYDQFYDLLQLNESDLWLLHNLLAGEESREETGQAFLTSFMIEDADNETLALMPLFLKVNGQTNLDPAIRDRINSMYRSVMRRNYLNLHGILPLLREFNQTDIPVMIMKGIALGHVYYQDLALRAMGDIDIAVPHHRFAEAYCIAMEHGFQGDCLLHSADLKKDGQIALDLHCQIFKESYAYQARETVLWERAETIDFYGSQVCLMCAEDLLLGILLNQFYDILCPLGQPGRPKKWIVDATVILQQKPDFDLELFVRECYRFRVMPQIICMLRSYQKAYSSAFGHYTIDTIVSKLEAEPDFNKVRMNLFARLWAYRDNPPLINMQKKYLQYIYFSYDQTSGHGFGISDYKKYTYQKYHAENFYQYARNNFRRVIENLKKKHRRKTQPMCEKA